MNTFFDMDAMTKAFNMENFLKAHKAGMDAASKTSATMAETSNKMAKRQMEMTQKAMEESIEAARCLSTAKGMEDFFTKQSELFRSQWQNSVENCKEMWQLSTKAQQEWNTTWTKQWDEYCQACTKAWTDAASATKKTAATK